MTGPVDRYLDKMFDQLSGTGPAGRRMLAEAEGHLLAATDEGRARGLDAEAAEQEAVDRFGPVATVVRHVPSRSRDLRQALSAAWFAAGVVLLWWGGSAVVTWLLGWPWTRLLIATDRFGTQPDMCGRPWVPSSSPVDCFTQHRGYLDLAPQGGDRDTYPWVALAGLLVLAAWLYLRRTTVLRAPAPLILAIPFGLAALVLMFYGVTGLTAQAQHWSLSYLVAGLAAAGISAAAFRSTAQERGRARPRS